MEEMPAFCPPNITIRDIWVNHGVSHCFIDTVTSSIICGFILLFGIAQLVIYRKFSTGIDAHRIRPSFLYKFQLFLMLLLPALTAVRFDLIWKYYDGAEIYGFMVSLNLYSKSLQLNERPVICRSFTHHSQSLLIFSQSVWL